MTDPVNSVAGRTGNVILTINDIVGFNNSNFANTAYVDMQLNAIVGGAPGALQTLANLANALNDDSNIASVIINDITVLQANDAAQSSNITALQGQVSTLTTSTAAISGRVSTLEGADILQDAGISDLQTDVHGILTGSARFQDLITAANGVYNLGSYTNQWKYGYFTDKIYLNNSQLTVDYYGNLRLNGRLVGAGAAGDLTYVTSDIIPAANVTHSLGNVVYQWKNIYAGNIIYLSGLPLTISNGNLLVNGNLVTGSGGGNVANLWNNGYTVSLNSSGNLTVPGLINFPQSQQVHTDGTGNNDNFIIFSANIRNDINGIQIGEVDQGATIYTSGTVQLYTNTAGASPQWTFDTIGNLIFPTGSQIVNGYPGTHGTVGDGTSWFATPPGSSGGVASADGQQYVQVNDGSGVFIGTAWTGSGHEWAFGRDGSLTMPAATNGESLIVASGTGLGISAGSKGWTFDNSGNLTFPDNTVQTTAFNNAAVGSYLADSTSKTFGDSVTVTGNLIVQGNLILNGNTTLVNTNNLIINDNIIYIANANPGSSLDIGIAGHFTSTRYQHTGLIRQASTNQWQLFSNVVPEPGGTVDFTNAIYDDIRVGNITSPTITGINANVSAANIGIKGYIDLANTIQSAQLTAANTAWAANASAQQSLISSLQSNAATQSDLIIGINANVTAANVGIIGYIDQGNSIQATAITTANTGMKGYVDSQTFYSNARVATYLQYGNVANISAAGNVTATYFVGNGALLTGIAASSNYSNVQVAAYLNTQGYNLYSNVNVAAYLAGTSYTNYSNVNVAAYLNATGYNLYSNANVASYLPTYSGNIANIRLGVAGVLTFPDGTTQTTAASGGGSNYGNSNVASYLITSGYVNTNSAYANGNVASYLITNGYVNTNSAYANANVTSYLPTHTGNVGVNNIIGTSPNVVLVSNSYSTTYDIYGNVAFGNALYPVQITAFGNISTGGYLFGNGAFLTGIVASGGGGSGTNYSNVNVASYLGTGQVTISNIKLGATGNVVFADGTTQTTAAVNNNFGNVNVKAYTETIGLTNYSNVNAKAYTETIGLTNYSNVNAKAYTESMGFQNYGNVNVAAFTSGLTNYSNINTAAYLSTATITTTGNISAAYVTGNITVVGNVTGTLPNVTIQAGVFTSVFDNQGNVTLPNVYVSGNVQTSGYLFGNGAFLTGIVAGSGGGTNYSNANVSSYLINSSSTFIGNTGNVSSVYALQSNITQLFIGNQTSLSSGNSSVTTNTWLLNNLYFNSAGNLVVRNTQSGYNYIQMGTNGIMLGGYLGASTANTVASVFTPWMTVNGTTGLVLTGGLTAGAAVAVNSASGVTTNQTTFPLVNATATTINFGGAATAINMGSTAGTGNVFFGGNAIIQAANGALGTTLYPLVLRPAGQFNYLLLTSSQGGYNSPPYTSQSLTGGSGTGMTASWSSVGGYVNGAVTVTNPGTGYRNGDVLTLPGGLGSTVTLYNYNAAKTSNTAASSYTFGFDGNLTLPGNIIFPSSSYIYGDFSNATVNSRTVFVTTGNSTTTGIYAVPSGTGTGAAWQAANSSNLTAASKIMITTNGSTDVQLVSGINGTGTYLPLSFYNNGSAQMQLTVAGNLNMSLNNSITANGTGYFIGNAVGTTASYTGNVTVGNLSVLGNLSANLLSITANTITGSGANTYIIAGAYTSTFDNAGNVILPNAYVSGGATVVGTVNSNGGTNGTAFAVRGSGAVSNVALGYFPPAGTPAEMAIRDYSTANSSMYFDNTIGSANVGGQFQFRSTSSFTQWARIDRFGINLPTRPAFRVNGTAGTAQTTANVNLKSPQTLVIFNQGSYYNDTTGQFVAPVAGLYAVGLNARVNTTGTSQIAVLKNGNNSSGNIACFWETISNSGTATHFGVNGTVLLAAGDYLSANILLGTITFDGNDNWHVTYIG
jgi:hypothetical protein